MKLSRKSKIIVLAVLLLLGVLSICQVFPKQNLNSFFLGFSLSASAILAVQMFGKSE